MHQIAISTESNIYIHGRPPESYSYTLDLADIPLFQNLSCAFLYITLFVMIFYFLKVSGWHMHKNSKIILNIIYRIPNLGYYCFNYILSNYLKKIWMSSRKILNTRYKSIVSHFYQGHCSLLLRRWKQSILEFCPEIQGRESEGQ